MILNILYFVNLGDSRTVLYYDNGIYYSTRDHKPTRKDELIELRLREVDKEEGVFLRKTS